MDNFEEHARDVLREVYTNSMNCDVILRTKQRKLPCHRLVLSFCSDFLKKILEEPTYATITPVIVIPDIAEDILEQILVFMYTGMVVKLVGVWRTASLDLCVFVCSFQVRFE